jgi:hypothetical protein
VQLLSKTVFETDCARKGHLKLFRKPLRRKNRFVTLPNSTRAAATTGWPPPFPAAESLALYAESIGRLALQLFTVSLDSLEILARREVRTGRFDDLSPFDLFRIWDGGHLGHRREIMAGSIGS